MFQINFAASEPIYVQLYTSVIKLAAAGVIKPGDKLPPVRIVAQELGINPNTAAKAYRELEQEGYIYSSIGRGSFLTDKLAGNRAKKLLIIQDFKKASEEAALYGVPKEDLLAVLNEAFKGG